MKNSLPGFFAFILFSFFSTEGIAQTYISGGVYNNTTWTLANSPYIVVDTVVVFPGVTLTIEPGVVVKFDDGKFVEIRQGSLIMAGTSTDSITITSNSASPTKGIYRGFTFTNPGAITVDYCIFKYADNPLDYCCLSIGTLFINHSRFYMNNICLTTNYLAAVINQTEFDNNNYVISYSPYSITVHQSIFNSNTNCFGDANVEQVESLNLDSCSFINNSNAVHVGGQCHIIDCQFLSNTHAIEMESGGMSHTIKDCIFCNCISGVYLNSLTTTHDTLMNCDFSGDTVALSSMLAYMKGNIFTDNVNAIDLRINPTDSIFNNYIYHNRIGLYYRGGATSTFFNNYICNNTYNIDYITSLNGTIPPVCYCESDSVNIRAKIYDGYIDITRGLLDFTPYVSCDSSAITVLPPINCPAVIIADLNENTNISKQSIEIYPNPTSSTFKLKNITRHCLLRIMNPLGEIVYSKKLSETIDQEINPNLSSGIYFVQLIGDQEKWTKKLVIE